MAREASIREFRPRSFPCLAPRDWSGVDFLEQGLHFGDRCSVLDVVGEIMQLVWILVMIVKLVAPCSEVPLV